VSIVGAIYIKGCIKVT